MENKFSLSIIIPVYNSGCKIKKLLDLFEGELTCNCELILVNDGSRDNTEDICLSYIDNHPELYIKYIRKENGGVSSARNMGITNSRGEYIAFVDADDRIEKNYISSILQIIEQLPDMGQFGYYTQIEGESERKENPFSELTEGISENLESLYCSYIYMKNNEVWNKVFKREIIEKQNIRFDTKLRYGEDLVFCMEYSKYIKTLMVSRDILYGYIKAAESVTYQFKSSFISDCVEVYKYIIQYFDEDIQLQRVAAESVVARLIERYQKQNEYRTIWTEAVQRSSLYDILQIKLGGYGIENRIRLLQLRAISKGNDVCFNAVNYVSKLYVRVRGKK